MASLDTTTRRATKSATAGEATSRRLPGRDHMSEYAEMMADIERTPRPTLWQRFTIALAGQR